MKKTIQVLTLVAVLLLCSNLYSQKSVKLGHFSSTELIKKMPEGDSAQATMQKYMTELQTEAETMQKEYDRLVGEYQAKEAPPRKMQCTIKKTKQAKRNSICWSEISRISTKCSRRSSKETRRANVGNYR